jgi:uncharacterized membrane protein YciS (DUF1049 family)
MDGAFKSVLTQLLTMSLAGFVGGWVSVQLTLVELRVNTENMAKHITELERIADQHTEFRERIARLEVHCDMARKPK